jgi:CheY-like chemotaxis protein
MNSKHSHSFAELFSSSFSFSLTDSTVRLAENFNLVFPADFSDNIDLKDFLGFFSEQDREAFQLFLMQPKEGTTFFSTLQKCSSDSKTGPFCSACLRVDSIKKDKVQVGIVNVSAFMPEQILYRDLKTLVASLGGIRKITHDLNNQFQIITGYGSTLQDELSDPDQKESASCIVTAVNQAISHNMQLRKLFPPKNPPQIFIPKEIRQTQADSDNSGHQNSDPKIGKASLVTQELPSIMVVDDEPLVKKFLCDMLKRLNFHPCGFESGKSAAEAIKALQKFELAILDMNLPDISTEELFGLLKACAPETKIILISGETQNASSTRMLEQGAGAYLQKPTSVKMLSETINKVIGDR